MGGGWSDNSGQAPEVHRPKALLPTMTQNVPIVPGMVDGTGHFASGRSDNSSGVDTRDESRWTWVPGPGVDPSDHPLPSGFQAALPPLGIILQSAGMKPRLVAQWGIPKPESLGGIEEAAVSVIESGAPHAIESSGCVLVPVGKCDGHVVLKLYRTRAPTLPTSTAHVPLSVAAPFDGLLGSGPLMVEFARELEKLAAGEGKIILFGETGTGKTMIAQMIHDASHRRGAFKVVDCSRLTSEQFEGEIFGHERGAYTGAQTARVGALEAARGGTLFLDEIGDLPLELQLRLLNAVENATFHRMGASANALPRQCDVRLITATHRDLKEGVRLGAFREDLYFRLGRRIDVPALRERGEDVLRLADRLLSNLARSIGAPPKQLTIAARKAISSYHWPGNVRELITTLDHAIRMVPGNSIDAGDLGDAAAAPVPTASLTVLPPARNSEIRATPTTPRPGEADAPNQKQIERFLVSFFKAWRTGAYESEDVLLTVLGKIGGGKPAQWLHYLRQGLLAGVDDSLEQNRLGDQERSDLRKAILSQAGGETGRDAWAIAAARLLGAGTKAAPLVKKAKEIVGTSS